MSRPTTYRSHPPSNSVVTREPLRLLLHPIALLAFAAAVQAFLDGADVRGVVAAVLGVLVVAATEAARSRVTPFRK
jgi:hypothetical protein